MGETQVDRFDIFGGAIYLGNPVGAAYLDHSQTDEITFSVGPYPVVLGSAAIKIIANGDAINVPAGWIKTGGDDISLTPDDENHLFFLYKEDGVVWYTNKVVTP